MAVKAKPDGTEAGRVCQVSPAPTESVTLLGMARACAAVMEGRTGGLRSDEEGMKNLQGWAGLGIPAKEGVVAGVKMLLGVIFLWL